MAAVPPVSGNNCKGTFSNGSPNTQLYCHKDNDANGDPIYTCATWKLFRAACAKGNRQCSNQSEAFVAAVTVCNQKLY